VTQLRKLLYRQLDPAVWDGEGLSTVNRAVLTVVFLSILAVVVESEPSIGNQHPIPFYLLNILFAALYTGEYVVRLWAMGASERYQGSLGTVKFALTPSSVIDLGATILLWLDVLFGFPGAFGVMARLVRVLRMLTLTRNSGMGRAIRLMGSAIRSRATELLMSFGLAGLVLLISSAILYAVEGQAQPDAFGSIPRAMWWGIGTLTTVAYGDVYPLTTVGKVLAGVVAVTSIAIVAMPTGIMAAAFSNAFQDYRKSDSDGHSDQ